MLDYTGERDGWGWHVTDPPTQADDTATNHEQTTTVTFTVPASVVSRRNMTPEAFACWVRVAAAMYGYGQGEITLGAAAALAGMSQAAFLRQLKEAKQDSFTLDLDDFRQELAYLAERRRAESAGG